MTNDDKDTIPGLLPCQACGGEFKIYRDTVDNVGAIAMNGGWYIGHGASKTKEVQECRLNFLGYFSTKEAAFKAVNTRADEKIARTDKAAVAIPREVQLTPYSDQSKDALEIFDAGNIFHPTTRVHEYRFDVETEVYLRHCLNKLLEEY